MLATLFLDRSSGYSFGYITQERLIKLLIGAIFALPVFAVTFSVWRRAMQKDKNNAYIYRLCMLSALVPLPLLLIRSCFEAGRLISAAVTTQLALLFMFVAVGEKAVCPAFREVCEWINRHTVPALVIAGIYAALSRLNVMFLGFIGQSLYKYFPF